MKQKHQKKYQYLILLKWSRLAKVVRTKEERIKAAEEMNADLTCAYLWGRPWSINVEPTKCFSLCVSLKRDTDCHPPLFMSSLPIKEFESLKILGLYFDKKLTWNTMISQLSTHCRQRMAPLYCVRGYLAPNGLAVAFRSFVRTVREYGGVAFMGASATHLSKFDKVQKLAERVSGRVFPRFSLAVLLVLLGFYVSY